ncbi:integrin alpha-PS3-like [Culicoides brevitarsis]|uniref:integrin alpha-PS3-like n=1 Tax=Culicoides brevitarsis TaxID=469753 RepID=UPI00307B2F9F
MNFLQLVIVTIIAQQNIITGFNISPVPNIIFKPPNLRTFMEKSESSLFGLTLTLKKSSILVGAPKAQTHLPAQRRVNETGGVYRCNFKDGSCESFIVDAKGNTNMEDTSVAYNSEKKDFQLLGYSMDGLSSDNSKFVVCSPKLKANLLSYQTNEDEHYLLHGACYWASSENDNTRINKIASLRARDKQVRRAEDGTHNIYENMYGQQGFSVHITENAEEIVMGAPGIYNWKGSVIRYRPRFRRQQSNQLKTNQKNNNQIEYVTEIVNPFLIDLPDHETLRDDSYLGYAVSSGYFAGRESNRLLYVASAPQAGKVFIFDFIDKQNNFRTDKTMKIFRQFESQQVGEYFGYSLLTEDINNDGLPDLLIGAPMYSRNSYFESGAVYIYINTGKLSFELQTALTSDYLFGGRFGTAMSKLGDINDDGFRDVAIGAPMEGNGAVYIFHGTSQGLSLKATQKIQPESQDMIKSPGMLFGHSLSNGVDIDANGYNDLAIGSPLEEKVFLYKTYPVVKISATLETNKKEIGKNDTRFQITACWRLFAATEITHDIDFNVLLKADTKYNRAKWINNNKFYDLNVTINNQMQCHEFDIAVFFNIADIFKPIEIEMEYRIVNQALINTKFCEKCVILQENSAQSVQTSVVYSTGCKASMCVADLRVKSSLSGSNLPYILGSTRTLAVKYEVENIGETAYLAQIKITLSNITSFAKIPSNCHKIEEDEMICDLLNGNPLFAKQTAKLIVNIDTSRLSGKKLMIQAEALSNGEELNFEDNKIVNFVELIEYSEVEIQGSSTLSQYAIEDLELDPVITHEIEITNEGPSTIRELSAMLFIPTVYSTKTKDVQLFNKSDLSIEVHYKDAVIPLTWYHDNQLLEATTLQTLDDTENDSADEFDMIEEKKMGNALQLRSKRSISGEENPLSHAIPQSQSQKQTTILDELPPNRTIHFNCRGNYVEKYSCMQIYFHLNNFKASAKDVIRVKISYMLHVSTLNSVFDENLNIFAMYPTLEINANSDENMMTGFKITQENLPYTIIFKHFSKDIELWIVITAALVGLFVLIVMSLILYKCGFFKRQKKEELQRLTQNENYTSYSNDIDIDEKY